MPRPASSSYPSYPVTIVDVPCEMDIRSCRCPVLTLQPRFHNSAGPRDPQADQIRCAPAAPQRHSFALRSNRAAQYRPVVKIPHRHALHSDRCFLFVCMLQPLRPPGESQFALRHTRGDQIIVLLHPGIPDACSSQISQARDAEICVSLSTKISGIRDRSFKSYPYKLSECVHINYTCDVEECQRLASLSK